MNANLLRTVCLSTLVIVLALEVDAKCTIQELSSLRREEIAFEFCGVNSTNYTGRLPESEKRLAFLISTGAECYDLSMLLLKELRNFEHCVLDGKDDELIECIGRIGRLMPKFANSKEGSHYAYGPMLELKIQQIEYSICRMLERQPATCLTKDHILRLLPNSLLEMQSGSDDFAGKRCRKFRDLLIVRTWMRSYEEDYGILPAQLEDLRHIGGEEFKRYTEGVSYQKEGAEWQMAWSPKHLAGYIKGVPFNVFVPLIIGYPKYSWQDGYRVVLSSDYSRKRRALYDGKTLNEGTTLECKMIDGIVLR